MKRGLLVVNSFLYNRKFAELYDFLVAAAEKSQMTLTVKRSGELFGVIGMRQKTDADFVLFWDKDLLLARAFENSGIRVFNSAEAIMLCDDKALTAEALTKAGVPTPKTMAAPKAYSGIGYTSFDFLTRAEETLSYPMVIKHRCGSFGAQVYLAQDRAEAEKILENCGGNEVILQEYISESCGRDLRINVVGGEIHGVMLRYNEHDFRSNITNGGKMADYNASEEYKKIAIDAARAVGADFAGVDVMFGKDGPIVCEVNSSPHFKTTLMATGINIAQVILSYIKGRI